MKQDKKTGAVLVVGAGIGGIQAALNLAESGYKVYLVEKSPAIGGAMAQLDKTFPTNDCAMCTLSPKLVECGRHLNIEILTCAEVMGIEGEVGNFEVLVKKHPRYIDLQKCTGCGDCAKVCPVEMPSEFDHGLASRKAIYRPYAQAFPSAFAIDKEGKPPCKLACPAGVNVQGYIALIRQGKYQEAAALIKERLPLPGSLGRICPHPCETECNRGSFDQAVSICALKRFVADQVKDELPLPQAEPKEEKIAIIGSGPAGLTAAYALAREGYRPTVFEALPVAGGMLYVGVPEYRLPKKVLQEEIEGIKRLGVEIKTSTPIGRDLTIDDLFKEGYRAAFIAVGAHRPQKLPLPGADLDGVLLNVPFLRDVNLGQEVKVGRRVVVLGGGNVAFDCARVARRLGAAEVRIACLEPRDAMLAWPEEIEAGEEEGIIIEPSRTFTRIVGENGHVSGVECRKVQSFRFDENGKLHLEAVEGSEHILPADTVIFSIGQVPELDCIKGVDGIETTPQGTIQVDPVTQATSREGIFAGGDVQTGTASAVEAVAAGHRAAESIIRYLKGEDIKQGREKPAEKPVELDRERLPKEHTPRQKLPALPVATRLNSFDEVDLGFSEEAALKEAERCLNCGPCSECLQCVAECKAHAVNHDMVEELVKLQVGSVVLCPGFDPFDPTPMSKYGYGRYPNVVTSLEFERILSASGPYQGKLLRPSDKKHPQKIAWIQCVGSRDVNQGLSLIHI